MAPANPIDQPQLGLLKQRADDIVSLAIKAAVQAHVAYQCSLDESSTKRGDVEKAVKLHGSKLAVLRATVVGQFDTVLTMVGGTPLNPVAPAAPGEVRLQEATAAPAAATPTAPLVLTPAQKLAATIEILGEVTNAQVQKWVSCDADKARMIIDELVKQGLLEKVSSKLYKSTIKPAVAPAAV